MAKSYGYVEWNDSFFEDLGKSAGMTAITKDAATKIMNAAVASAPVDSGDYKSRFELVMKTGKSRNIWLVRNNDWKALLIEAKTGNLARAIKAAK